MNRIYEQNLVCIEQLCKTTEILSKNTSGKTVDKWKIAEGTIIFYKIYLTSIALLKLLPHSCYYSPLPYPELWDLSSVATLTRSLTETYHTFFYIAIEQINDDESNFRRLLWEYHDICQRFRILNKNPVKSPRIPKIEKSKREHKERLINNTFFKTLSKNLRKKIKDGQKEIYLENIEISKRAGINPDYFSMPFIYCSNHVHTSGFSTSHLSSNCNADPNCLNIYYGLMTCIIFYLCVSIRDFLILFPKQQKNISPEVSEIIDKWQTRFKINEIQT